jgi:hypothetical protein
MVAALPSSLLLVGQTSAAVATIQAAGSAYPGMQLRVEGRSFDHPRDVQLLWDDSPAGMPTVRTRSHGDFSVLITVPASAAEGAHRLSATVLENAPRRRTANGGSAETVVIVTVAPAADLGPSTTPTPTLPRRRRSP